MLRLVLIAAASLCVALPAAAETRSYNFNSFTKLDVSAGYEVNFTQGAKRSVTIESDNFDKIVAEQKGDTLVIGRPRNTNVNSRKTDVVTITAPDLDRIELNAGVGFNAGPMTVDDLELDLNAGVEATFSQLKAKTVRLDANAGVSIDIKGECDTLVVEASAGATLKAKDFRCRTVRAEGQAGATLRIHAVDAVKADAGVGASIQVAGKPKSVEKHASLGGSVSID